MSNYSELPSVHEFIHMIMDEISAEAPAVAADFEACFLSNLTITAEPSADGSVFLPTGDIPAMWLRDSACQFRPYLFLVNQEPKIDALIRGVIQRQMQCILLDPYGNAFTRTPETESCWTSDHTTMCPGLWERKFEIDSLCYPFQLAWLYWKESGRTEIFDQNFIEAARTVYRVFRTEQHHEEQSAYRFQRDHAPYIDSLSRDGKGALVRSGCGLIWSGFRPSDDACQYGYLIPSNMIAVVILEYLEEIARDVYQDTNFAEACRRFADEVRAAIQQKAVIPTGSQCFNEPIYAYEVDGFGQYLVQDDANFPNLLSAPFLGFCSPRDVLYEATKRRMLSHDNPYYYEGTALAGVGSIHTRPQMVWHLSLGMQGLVAEDRQEQLALLRTMAATDAGSGLMHESVFVNDPACFTRPLFGWANAVYAELVLQVCGYRLKGRQIMEARNEKRLREEQNAQANCLTRLQTDLNAQANVPFAGANSSASEDPRKYRITSPQYQTWMKSLREDLLRFGRKFPSPAGGSYYLGDDGTPWKDRNRETWITARMAHVYGIGHLLGYEGCGELADQAIQGLLHGELRDKVNGGWYAGVTSDGKPLPGKQCYAHAFVILAACTGVLAKRPGAEELLEEALKIYDEKFWNEEEGMSCDWWNTEFTEMDSYRGLNANMHTVEAFLAVADVTGREEYRRRCGRIIERVMDWAKTNNYRTPEHFTADWVPDKECNRERPDDPFKPYGATPGHGIEWARLILQYAESSASVEHLPYAGDHFLEVGRETYVAAASRLYERAVADGWNADGAQGICYTTDWDGRPVVHDRMHWTLAEAINTSAAFYQVTGIWRYAEDHEAFLRYLDACVLDHELGSWFHQLDRNNQVIGTVWPGKSDLYHAFQATLIPSYSVRKSIAFAVMSDS